MFRKVMLVFLALVFCAFVVAGIDLVRHAMAGRRLENAGVRLRDWHYRFSGKAAAVSYGYDDLQSWRGRWRRMIAVPRQASLFSRQPAVLPMMVDRKVLRDLALLGIEEVEMYDCRGLTPDVMSELSRNGSLRVLIVARCDVTNEGLNLLWPGCPNLQAVQIVRNGIGDEAFRDVKAARALKVFGLWYLDISQQTIAYLAEAPSVERLALGDLRVGEEWGPPLAAMRQLRRVQLQDVTAGGVILQRLRVLRPDIMVTLDSGESGRERME